jgi:hypothetical protein
MFYCEWEQYLIILVMNEKYRSDCSQRIESIAPITLFYCCMQFNFLLGWFRVFEPGQVEFGCNNVQTDEIKFGFKMQFEI